MYFSNQIKASSMILFSKVMLLSSLQPLWELQNKLDFNRRIKMQPSIDPDYIASATWIFFHISCFTFHDIVFAADHCYNQQAIVMTAAAKSKQI